MGILPAQTWTGKMPIPQEFQIKLHIALGSFVQTVLFADFGRFAPKISNSSAGTLLARAL
jgi:hypothetical protein